jgi:hypothetical protein
MEFEMQGISKGSLTLHAGLQNLTRYWLDNRQVAIQDCITSRTNGLVSR